MTATVRAFTALLVAVLLGFAGALPVEAQVWKKLKKAKQQASQVLEEIDGAIRCGLDDKDCLEKARSEGRPAVLTDEKGNVIRDKDGEPTVVSPDDNQFAEGTTVERLGSVEDSGGAQYEISADGAHVAIPGLQGSRQTVFVNGRPGVALDKVFFSTFTFSPTGGRYAYVGRKGDECIVVLDGKEMGDIYCDQREVKTSPIRKANLFQFSRDGKKMAYRKEVVKKHDSRGGWGRGYRSVGHAVVIDGETGPTIDMGYRPRLLVRGNNVFYAGSPSQKQEKQLRRARQPQRRESPSARVYVNHEPGPEYHAVKGLIASDDGKHYAYIATSRDMTERVVINGAPGPSYAEIQRLFMDVRSGSVFYEAAMDTPGSESRTTTGQRRENGYIIQDQVYLASESGFLVTPQLSSRARRGWRGEGLTVMDALSHEDDTNLPTPSIHVTISPDGERHAFVAQTSTSRTQGAQRVWVDGKASLDYEEITEVQFTGDSKHLIFIAHTGNKAFVVVDGTELGPFDRARNLQVSEAGGAYAFIAEDNRDIRWYVNGKPVGIAGNPKEFEFSPDGTRYAYGTSEGGVVIDGEQRSEDLEEFSGPREDESYRLPPSFVFSPKENRLAYVVNYSGQTTKDVLVLDGEKTVPEKYNTTFGFPAFSPDDKHFAYLQSTWRSGELPLWRLYINGKPGPVVGERLPSNSSAVSFIDNNTIRVVGFMEDEIIKHTVSF